jgi:mannose-1-phosphate guanylyltransferase
LTFGITPTHPASGFGYLELGDPAAAGTREVRRFKEKPDQETARRYLESGPDRYLWNSGMFVWKASTFLACVERYEPEVHAGIERIAASWDTSERVSALGELYPGLRKISVDYGVMEPASADPSVRLLTIPMPLHWRDIGSWSSYAEACPQDVRGNSVASGRATLVDCSGTLTASTDPKHLIAAVGCQDLIIVHTDTATLVCPKDRAQEIKDLQARILTEQGEDYL